VHFKTFVCVSRVHFKTFEKKLTRFSVCQTETTYTQK
jgi:hypothetical protein